MAYLASLIHIIFQLLSLLIIASAVLSFFMSPFHPIRQTVDRFVNPMLQPIRKIVPMAGMIDLSPLILLIILQVLDGFISNLFLSIH